MFWAHLVEMSVFLGLKVLLRSILFLFTLKKPSMRAYLNFDKVLLFNILRKFSFVGYQVTKMLGMSMFFGKV